MVRGAQGKQAEGVIRGRCPQEPWGAGGLGGRGGAEAQGQLMDPSSSDISAQPCWAPGFQPSDLLGPCSKGRAASAVWRRRRGKPWSSLVGVQPGVG